MEYNWYADYLQSEYWSELVMRIKTERKKCEICGALDNLQLHHLSYRNLCHERDDDVMLVCKNCHEQKHFSSKWIERKRERNIFAQEMLKEYRNGECIID